jgi:hypothetical protein
VIGLIIFFFFVVLGMYAFYMYLSILYSVLNTRHDIDISKAENIAAIGDFSGIHFPRGVVWENAFIDGFQEKFIACKFYASNEDIQKMFAEKNPKWSNTVRHLKNDKSSSWFKPDSIKNFQSTRIENKDKWGYIDILYENIQTKNNTDLLLVYMIVAR